MDRRIFERAAAEGFRGPVTRKLLLTAYEYAHPVMSFLIGTGRIFSESARLGRPVRRQPEDVQWTADDRAFLIQSCVDKGIFDVFYEYGLKKGRWDPGPPHCVDDVRGQRVQPVLPVGLPEMVA